MAESDPPAVAGPLRQRILAEAASIAATQEFARAPVMLRLLNFLVDETLTGRGDQLKAYAVAVDGLGRSPNFDAQGDSYPRVQVGRLRKMLDKHYAHHAPEAGLRLSIPAGGYRVAFTSDEAQNGLEYPAAAPPLAISRIRWWRISAVFALILVLAIVAGWAFLDEPRGPASSRADIVPPPMLELVTIRTSDTSEATQEAVRATLLDSLGRSGVIQVRARRRQGVDIAPIPRRYALGGDLAGGRTPTLFLRLWRVDPDRLIWSDRVALPKDPASFGEALAPLLATITRSNGVIVINERAERQGDDSPGYPCLLRFEHYRNDRTPARHAEAAKCISRTLAIDPNHAWALAASSTLALDEIAYLMPHSGDRASPIMRALALARRAIVSDPFSAFTNYALARALLHAGDCPGATRNGLNAAQLDPNDPAIMASVGMYLIDCQDPRGEDLVRRAIRLDPNAPTYHSALAWSAVGRGDGAAARAAVERMEQPASGQAFHYITAATAFAADGDFPAARAAWQRVKALEPAMARDPASLFGRWRFSPNIRTKSLAYLHAAGLIPPTQLAGPPGGPQVRADR